MNLKNPPQPYWLASTPETNYPKLDSDITVDVAIVGGGIAGITAAYLLKNEGYKIAIIEADRIVQGTSGHTTAKITSQHGLIYDKTKNRLGKDLAKQYADANEGAIHFISKLIEEKNISCDFSWQPAYVYTLQDNYISKIEAEVNAASSLGISAEYTDVLPIPIKVKAAMRFNGQAQFHPRKYLLELVKDIPNKGSYIFEQTRAVDIEKGTLNTVVTENGKRVKAKHVIITTHFPFYDGGGLYFSRLYPYKSYCVGVKVKEKFPGGMYITAEHPTRSLRSQSLGEGEMVIAAGEHHKTGHGTNLSSHYENLINFVEGTFSMEDILYRWSTQDYTSMDEIPYIGHLTSDTPNIYVATGFRKWGMTNSTVAAILLKDLIVNGYGPWQEVYRPSRFNVIASAAKFVKENADVAVQLVKGKLQAVPDNVEIKVGEAKLVEGEGQKLGAYRDEKGVLHVIDATCTHMGCELSWNDAELTWDCPCHGSRFTYEGEIVEGPTINFLKHNHEGRNTIDPNIF